ncbi:MAG TPA: hypothetical protein VGK59_07270 [Ohtaekwangia sp.]
MKQKFFNLLLGAALVAVLFSCSDDDKKSSNSVTIDGKKYTFEDDGSFWTYQDGDLYFFEGSVYGISGNQFADVSFEVASENDGDGGLPVGNYTYADETLNDFDIEVYDDEFNTIAEYYDVKSGNLEITKSGDTYTVTFNITFETDEGDVTIKGTYKGTFEELS